MTTDLNATVTEESAIISRDIVSKFFPGKDPDISRIYVEELCDESGVVAGADRPNAIVGELAPVVTTSLILPLICTIVVQIVKERYFGDPYTRDLGLMGKKVYETALKNGLSEADSLKMSKEFIDSVTLHKLLKL